MVEGAGRRIVDVLVRRTESDEITWKAMDWRAENDDDETAICWRALWYDCEIVLEHSVSSKTGLATLSVMSPDHRVQGIVVLDDGDSVGMLVEAVQVKPHEKRVPKDILNKPFLLETCRTWQRRGRRPRSGRSLPPLSPLRLVPDRASGSLVQAGRLAGKAAGRTTPSVVPPPPAGCPGRTATPGAPCSWPAPGSAPCRIRTAASTAGTDAPL